MYIGNIQI